jgi:hypothetical protein
MAAAAISMLHGEMAECLQQIVDHRLRVLVPVTSLVTRESGGGGGGAQTAPE